MSHLPTTLLFNDYLFVHAGVEPRDNYKGVWFIILPRTPTFL